MSRTKQSARKGLGKKRSLDSDHADIIPAKRLKQEKSKPELSQAFPGLPLHLKHGTCHESTGGKDLDEHGTSDATKAVDSARNPRSRTGRSAQDLKQKTSKTQSTHDDFDASIAAMNPQLLADQFAKFIKRHLSSKTAIELEDIYLPTKAFVDTTSFTDPHTLVHLPEYLEVYAGGKEKLSTTVEIGSPHTLFICPSAIRAADCVRALQVFHTDDSAIAKLFAKHMKLTESIEYVQKTRFGIGVGTPVRMNDLMKSGALKVDALKRIVIEGSYLDEKKRSIFSMKELFLPLLDFLDQEHIRRERHAENGCGIQIFVF